MKCKYDFVSGDFVVSHLMCRFRHGRIVRVLFPYCNSTYVDYTLYGDYYASSVFQYNHKTKTFYECNLRYWAFKKALYSGNLYYCVMNGFRNLLIDEFIPNNVEGA